MLCSALDWPAGFSELSSLYRKLPSTRSLPWLVPPLNETQAWQGPHSWACRVISPPCPLPSTPRLTPPQHYPGKALKIAKIWVFGRSKTKDSPLKCVFVCISAFQGQPCLGWGRKVCSRSPAQPRPGWGVAQHPKGPAEGLGAEGWGQPALSSPAQFPGCLHFLGQKSVCPTPLSLFGLSKPLLKLYLKTFSCNFTVTLKLTQHEKLKRKEK